VGIRRNLLHIVLVDAEVDYDSTTSCDAGWAGTRSGSFGRDAVDETVHEGLTKAAALEATALRFLTGQILSVDGVSRLADDRMLRIHQSAWQGRANRGMVEMSRVSAAGERGLSLPPPKAQPAPGNAQA
jgi:hypothetical protein